MRITAGAASDRGRVRQVNEDDYAVRLADGPGSDLLGMLVVADGMGGHAAGEVASAIVVDYFETWFASQRTNGQVDRAPNWGAIVRLLIEEANRRVYAVGLADPDRAGLGSTIVAAIMTPNQLHLGSVGDSRAYLVNDSDVFQLTEDHSWVAEEVQAGRLTAAAAAHHPRKNILTRAVGVSDEVQVDSRTYDLLPGDYVLLCTDGLTNQVSEVEIAAAIRSEREPQRAATTLVNLTLRRGAPDNVTVVIAAIDRLTNGRQPRLSDVTLPSG